MIRKTVKIKDLGTIITGTTPPTKNQEYYGQEYNFIKPTYINLDSRFFEESEMKLSQAAYEKYSNTFIPPLSTSVVTIGSIGQKICMNRELAITNQQVNSVIPNTEKYDNMFVFYLLKHNLYKVKAANSGSSSGRENVNKTTFGNIEVEVPDLITQRKIGRLLSSYDDLIENNLKKIKLLEESAELIYKEWFVNLKFPGYEKCSIADGIPDGWEVKELKDICEVTMGQSPKSEFYNDSKQGLPFHQGVTDFGDRFVTHTKYCTKESKIANQYDILCSVRAPVGRLNIALDRLIIGRGLCSIRNKDGYQSFQFYQLKNYFFKKDLIGGGTIFNSVTKVELESQKFIVPPKNMKDKFEYSVIKLDKQIEILYQENKKLKEARDILIPRLISGEIEV